MIREREREKEGGRRRISQARSQRKAEKESII